MKFEGAKIGRIAKSENSFNSGNDNSNFRSGEVGRTSSEAWRVSSGDVWILKILQARNAKKSGEVSNYLR